MALTIVLIAFLLHDPLAIQKKWMENYRHRVFMYPACFVLINISQHPY